MSQNKSHAVMAQRFESRESLDDFPTPPWATRALLTYVIGQKLLTPWSVCYEPACNRGFMVKALRERFAVVHASDIVDYGFLGAEVRDFLFDTKRHFVPEPNWIITNPPFVTAEMFAHRAITDARDGVALLV